MAFEIIVSAYAVHPSPNSAEGVVNAALLDALREQWDIDLVTSSSGYTPLTPPKPCWRAVRVHTGQAERRRLPDVLAGWLQQAKWHPCGMAARALDRGCRALNMIPIPMRAWANNAGRQLLAVQARQPSPIPVWARGLPPDSFQAAITASQQNPFPLVVNYNDPMPHCLLRGEHTGSLTPALDRLQHRQNAFLREHAQAFTFPSRRLAELMAGAAGFDRRRCFVIPHANVTPECSCAPTLSRLVYAGSFYASVFSQELLAGLAAYAASGGRLRLDFVLKKPSASASDWLQKHLPQAQVHVNLSPVEAATLCGEAGACLVADAPRHRPLLLTKVAQAVATGCLTIAFTKPDSTTAEVVKAAGGMVIEPTSADAVCAGLRQFEELLASTPAREAARRDLQKVQSRFSPQRIIEDSGLVLDYAQRRFEWRMDRGARAEPPPPCIENWP